MKTRTFTAVVALTTENTGKGCVALLGAGDTSMNNHVQTLFLQITQCKGKVFYFVLLSGNVSVPVKLGFLQERN